MAKLLILIGVICIGIGIVLLALDQFGLSKYIGNLPGDINFTKGNVSFHFSILTSLLVSILLTVLFNLFFR